MPRRTARNSDPQELYELSVQGPEIEVAFLDRVFRTEGLPKPRVLREDFCGSGALSRAWVKSRPDREAYAIDLHRPTLAWARDRAATELGKSAKRLRFLEANVLSAKTPKVDVAIAYNFSYFVFHTRAALLAYFARVRASVKPDGLFLLDILGGPGAMTLQQERRKVDGFTYVWDQAALNPVDNHYTCHIHFEFPDGSKLQRAFTYDWRLWSLMEVRDALVEAGFARTEVWWEGTDRRTNTGNGVYAKKTKAPNDEAWVSYIVAFP
jgi:cyclopropane fatty-acyl-phospholipid synthase-like methyltransferase